MSISYVNNGDSGLVARTLINQTISEVNSISGSFPFTGSAIITGSLVITGSTTSTGGFTGSLFGTSSWAISSSHAVTSSYALSVAGGITFPYTGSAVITGSLVVTGSTTSTGGFTGSLLGTASNSTTASYALTASFVTIAQTASYVLNAVSASYAPSSAPFPYTGSAIISGSLSVIGSVYNILGGFTGSLQGTASYANQALSSSHAISASHAVSSSYALSSSYSVSSSHAVSSSYTLSSSYAVSSSHALTASFVTTAQTASYVLNAVSASYALTSSFASTASFVKNAQTASYVPLVAGPGVTINELAITASVRTVNGIFPSDGNISTALTGTKTGTSASLVLSSSGTVTGSIPDGLVWIISGDPTPANNGDTYIFSSGSVGQWYPISTLDTAAADTRYLKLDGSNSPMSGDIDMGDFNLTNVRNMVGTASLATLAVTANTASYVVTAQTASYVLNAVSASNALTASYVLNAVSSSYTLSSSYATTSSVSTTAQTASYVLNAVSASYALSSSFSTTASYVRIAQTASYVLYAVSASYAVTASYVLNALSASYALNALSASYVSGSILGTVSATNGLIPIASGVLNNITTSGEWSINSARTNVKLGSGSMFYTDRGVDIYQNYAGRVGFSITNPSTTGFQQLLFAESSTKFGGWIRYNSAYAGNYTSTSLPLADSFQLQAGSGQDSPLITSGTPIINIIGNTSTNKATRLDAIGLRIGTNADIHNANTIPFEVNGATRLSGSFTVIGNSTITGSLIVTQGITGSLLGTASYASQALSSSYAVSASYVPPPFPYTGSAAITGSLIVTGSTTTRIVPRVLTITTSLNPSINTDLYDAVSITALNSNISSMTTNLTGTPNNFDKLTIRIKDDGVSSRLITWGAKFVAMGTSLPPSTTTGKITTVGFIYDTVLAAWGCVSIAQQS
jgi:hypothetical protein